MCHIAMLVALEPSNKRLCFTLISIFTWDKETVAIKVISNKKIELLTSTSEARISELELGMKRCISVVKKEYSVTDHTGPFLHHSKETVYLNLCSPDNEFSIIYCSYVLYNTPYVDSCANIHFIHTNNHCI